MSSSILLLGPYFGLEDIDPSVTSFSWTANTTKNLATSNLFFLCLVIQGETAASANSHYFNITSKEAKPDSATTSTTRSVSTSASNAADSSTYPESIPSATHPLTTNASSAAASTQTSTTLSPKPSSGELSSGAKAVIGLGIFFAAILGIAAGWFLFGRKGKQNLSTSMPLSPYEPPKWQPPHVYQLDAKTFPPSIYELQTASEARR